MYALSEWLIRILPHNQALHPTAVPAARNVAVFQGFVPLGWLVV
jgi:hypothetical protein